MRMWISIWNWNSDFEPEKNITIVQFKHSRIAYQDSRKNSRSTSTSCAQFALLEGPRTVQGFDVRIDRMCSKKVEYDTS